MYDSRSVVAIFTELAERLGYGDYFPWKTEEEYMGNQLQGQEISLEELAEKGYFVTDAQQFYKYREWGSFNPPTGFGSSGNSVTGKYNFINPAAERPVSMPCLIIYLLIQTGPSCNLIVIIP